jgi:hypothetical protein
MKVLGKTRSVATVIAVAVGLASVADGPVAFAQIAPTGAVPPQPAGATAAPKPAPPAAAPPAATPAPKPAGAAPTSTPTAGPPGKPVDPKALFASGEKKFKAGDFTGALADFEASNAAKAAPENDRYIGLAQDNLGHFPEAVAAYERFLAAVPARMKEQGDEAQKRVEAIKALPGKLHVETTPSGAQVVLDSAASPEAVPTPTDLELKAGKHTVRFVAEGYEPTEASVEIAFGAKQDLKVELTKRAEPPPPPPVVAEAPPPPVAPPPPPPAEPRSKVPAYVTGAVAIVAAGFGTGFGIKALSQSSDFDKGPTTKKADDGENSALVADMLFGVAITFGVTSAVLFLSNDAPQTAKADPSVRVAKRAPSKITITPTPYVTPSGGGAGALVRF